MPYRSAHVDREKRTAEPGIVADMVRQFADKHAFLRELVQNGIDAGASKIEVLFDRDDRGVVRTAVTDDGVGMSRAVIEGPLLTLFSSSKEEDKTKIGKYGIGFVSVFALEPDHVEVRTATKGEAWLLRLFGDHSWELAEDKGADRGAVEGERAHGTTVSLVQPMDVDAFTAHVTAAIAALAKWCRHARVPIDVTVLDAGDPAATRKVAIQEPFGAAGLVSVLWTEGDERIVASCGEVQGEPASLLGYYNRGLTLFEATDFNNGVLEGVRVKIDSPKLSHTLSRDGVVRDREHARLQRLAVALVRDRLWPELVKVITQAAFEASSPARYLALVRSSTVPAFAEEYSGAQISVPLVDPINGQSTLTLANVVKLARGEVLFSNDSNAMTRALAANGTPVISWVECMPYFFSRSTRPEWLCAEADRAIAYSAPEPDRHTGDDQLEATLLALLNAVDRDCSAVQLSRFAGVAKDVPYRVTSERDCAIRGGKLDKPRWARSAIVHLNVEDAGVRLARRRARTDAKIAAHLLLRALLVADGPLSPKLVDLLLEAALDS